MSGERVLNDPGLVAHWAERLRLQVGRFLDLDGPVPARTVNNMDWLGDLGALELLRDVGKHFRLGTMLAKDNVARRLGSDEGISFTEFAYQVLQGMDFLELHRRHGCTLQTGGNDQWGNLLSGVELVRRVEHVSVHALTSPLITKADGTKFGKTEGGAVWLDPDRLSPYGFYQFWLNTADDDAVRFLKIFTFLTPGEIDDIAADHHVDPTSRRAQRLLAEEVTRLVHGDDATRMAVAASRALFSGEDPTVLDEATLVAAIAQLPHTRGATLGTPLVDIFVASGLVDSRGAARRAASSGGLSVNNVRVTDIDSPLAASHLLHQRWSLLRRGKKAIAVADTTSQP